MFSIHGQEHCNIYYSFIVTAIKIDNNHLLTDYLYVFAPGHLLKVLLLLQRLIHLVIRHHQVLHHNQSYMQTVSTNIHK